MNWAGDMTGAEMIAQFQSAYVPSLIKRNTIWTFKAGKPVYLLREPGGPVWVLQEYTKAVDPSLTPDNLDELGGKLKNLPKGWTFETKVLDQGPDARHRPQRRLGGHHSRRSALHLPGLRIRRGHQRQLRAVASASRGAAQATVCCRGPRLGAWQLRAIAMKPRPVRSWIAWLLDGRAVVPAGSRCPATGQDRRPQDVARGQPEAAAPVQVGRDDGHQHEGRGEVTPAEAGLLWP